MFNNNFSVVASSVSFNTTFTPVAQLSKPQTERAHYGGLLYTPDISSSNCLETQSVIAQNLTYQDLPFGKNLIAFAPASDCREQYLSQALRDGARALVLYPPALETSPDIPPSSAAYSSAIPVYFATWSDASPVANAMNQYNTDLLHVPHGQNLSESFANNDYVRLLLSIHKSGPRSSSLPGLWIFLLIVLGLLCFVVAVTSIAMHTHQYIARRELRRRIASGEVDLEGLGIKRLTVPKKHVDAFHQGLWQQKQSVQLEEDVQTNHKGESEHGSSFDQTSCPICLEDYQSNVSIIRELPCRHIYHQTCIDPFLLKRSSLCPMCKQSVLPKGYIPPDALLTSATVMRERRRRRQASRSDHSNTLESNDPTHSGAINLEQLGRPAVSLANLAPDNEEEARILQNNRSTRFKRLWRAMFPS